MKLILFRHGEAAMHAPGGDSARPLTERGMEDVGKLARNLAFFLKDAACFCSPYVRAVETAGIACAEAGNTAVPHKSGWLVPEADVHIAFQELSGIQAETVVFYGHNPHLSLLSALCTGADIFQLGKAHALMVQWNGIIRKGHADPVWLAVPEMFRS